MYNSSASLLTANSIFISIFPTSALHHTFIRAFRHIRPFIDSETSETVACAIVGSRLDYAGIASRNMHRLQRVQNSLARVVTRSTTNTTSALNAHHSLPIRQRINYKLATLVHRSLYHACPQYS